MYTYTYTYIYPYIHAYSYVYTYIRIYTYIHDTYTHIYIYTYIYIYIERERERYTIVPLSSSTYSIYYNNPVDSRLADKGPVAGGTFFSYVHVYSFLLMTVLSYFCLFLILFMFRFILYHIDFL